MYCLCQIQPGLLSLNEAKNIIVHSQAWTDTKEDFVKYQQEILQEFLEFHWKMKKRRR
jgi:hypothetical protein